MIIIIKETCRVLSTQYRLVFISLFVDDSSELENDDKADSIYLRVKSLIEVANSLRKCFGGFLESYYMILVEWRPKTVQLINGQR